MRNASHPGLAAALGKLAHERDPAAWASVLESAGSAIGLLATRLTGDTSLADDVVQETLLHIRDDAGQFQPNSSDPDGSAYGWIMRVTTHTALQLLRSRNRLRLREQRAHAAAPVAVPRAPEDGLERQEQHALVRNALSELPEAMQSAVVMRHLVGASFGEIAVTLGIPEGTAKIRVHRGLARLRDHLGRLGVALTALAVIDTLQQLPATETTGGLLTGGGAHTLLTAPLSASSTGIGPASTAIGVKIGILTGVGLALAAVAAVIASTHFTTSRLVSATDAEAVQRVAARLGPTAWDALRQRLSAYNRELSRKDIELSANLGEPVSKGGALHGMAFDWDSYFGACYYAHWGIWQVASSNAEGFLLNQRSDGFVPQAFAVDGPSRGSLAKPFLAQLLLFGYRQHPDLGRLQRTYAPLIGYVKTWEATDHDGNGLATWSGDGNFYRFAKKYACEGVDLNCYRVREYEAMAIIARELDRHEDSLSFSAKAEALRSQINLLLWNEKDGFYHDRDESTGLSIPVKNVGGFMPLWAHVASDERARRLVESHLMNPDEFWRSSPLPCYAANDPFGQHENRTWVNANYLVFHGLLRYGFHDEATQLAERCLTMVMKSPQTFMFYDSESGLGANPKPLYSFTRMAYLMPFEAETGADPTDLENPRTLDLAQLLQIESPRLP